MVRINYNPIRIAVFVFVLLAMVWIALHGGFGTQTSTGDRGETSPAEHTVQPVSITLQSASTVARQPATDAPAEETTLTEPDDAARPQEDDGDE